MWLEAWSRAPKLGNSFLADIPLGADDLALLTGEERNITINLVRGKGTITLSLRFELDEDVRQVFTAAVKLQLTPSK